MPPPDPSQSLPSQVRQIQTLLPECMLWDWVRLGSRLVRLIKDRQHQTLHPALLDRLLAQARASAGLRRRRAETCPQPTYPPELPITPRSSEIVQALREHPVIIVAGETGSGKTTQLPKMCLEAGLGIEGKIGCTQPRRVAALSISRRIADELGVPWGREVGCRIRFEDRSEPSTLIKLMTDGMLLAELQGDPLLSEYTALIIDEAHERSLNIDFLLGHLRLLSAKRPNLRIIISSATIDTAGFSAHFGGAPIIEVSGRMFPVREVYSPLDAALEESGELTYIDAAVQASLRLLNAPGDGDVLVFMPSERDIRETADLLEGSARNEVEVVPLFGRLSSGDQQRVFNPGSRRRVIVATNIAETSLTLPRIRYVVDTGLARISRYNPRNRTRRLPIEPISQSSANQRKGRSGRLRDGVCVRLYSEADFLARPLFTQPEIQRANLAEVILRMKAFRLGEVETFPFLNPPTPAAIQGGYRLLQELGALNEKMEITQLGRDLARLPIDPILGRMLLQAHHEHATRELLIIASGLSIQDPRERPMDQKEAAQRAHLQFADPKSDFLALLKLWNAVHEQWESLPSQNQRRKFCRTHFLSYLRMREWQDLHAQLHRALEDIGAFDLNETNADYNAIHRAILSGLLGHVAQRQDRNLYLGLAQRKLAVFPGSALHARPPVEAKKGLRAPRAPQQPEWVVAGEIVETSQVFARTLAEIDPEWIPQLAPHLCRVEHVNPHWSPEAGKVLAEEQLLFGGLLVRRRVVAYGNVNPIEATALFIRGALVQEALQSPESGRRGSRNSDRKPTSRDLLEQAREDIPALPETEFGFLRHNRQLRHKIQTWQTRSRHHGLVDLDQVFFDFYHTRLHAISSIDELRRRLRGEAAPDFLCATEADLVGDLDLSFDHAAFPDIVPIQGHSVPLSYAYRPGEVEDGVTVRLELPLAQAMAAAHVEWAVPGLREAQVLELLRALPKTLRRELMPLAPKVADILHEFVPGSESLKTDLARFLRRKYGVAVPDDAWRGVVLPDHLLPRVEVVGPDQKVLRAGRDLAELRTSLKENPPPEDVRQARTAWERLASTFEQFDLRTWSFGDLPKELLVSETGGARLLAFPGLERRDGQVNLRLFATAEAAGQESVAGVQALVEHALAKPLAWLQRELRCLAALESLHRDLMSSEAFQESVFNGLKRHVLPGPIPALTAAGFQDAVGRTERLLPGLAAKAFDLMEPVLKLRADLRGRYCPANAESARDLKALQHLGQGVGANLPFVATHLNGLVTPRFPADLPFAQWIHLPRYLQALSIRAQRARVSPAKDQERSGKLRPYFEALQRLSGEPGQSIHRSRLCDDYRWMLEEYKVSLFAQELGTVFPVSPSRLDQQLQRIEACR